MSLAAPDKRYIYHAHVIAVYDGDTITVDIDYGMRVWHHGERVRLHGIDTPELRGDERPEGLVARDYLRRRILGKKVLLETFKDKQGKYGRWLATVWIDGQNVNDQLIEEGYAVRWVE